MWMLVYRQRGLQAPTQMGAEVLSLLLLSCLAAVMGLYLEGAKMQSTT